MSLVEKDCLFAYRLLNKKFPRGHNYPTLLPRKNKQTERFYLFWEIYFLRAGRPARAFITARCALFIVGRTGVYFHFSAVKTYNISLALTLIISAFNWRFIAAFGATTQAIKFQH